MKTATVKITEAQFHKLREAAKSWMEESGRTAQEIAPLERLIKNIETAFAAKAQ